MTKTLAKCPPTQNPLIKMCGFTRLQDAQAAVQLGADALGFVFYPPSPRAITPLAAGKIIEKLPASVLFVGLFVNHSEAQVIQAVADSGVTVLQFHGTETPAFCDALSQRTGLPYWKAVHVAKNARSEDLLKSCQLYGSAQALLFDTASPAWGGTGHTFEWHTLEPLAQLANVPPLVLSGGLNAPNVAQGIGLLKPWAVDVSSGIEAQDAQGQPLKGIKDAAKMAAFVAAVRSS
jgi:phosphoribosylanthranilate isomerase